MGKTASSMRTDRLWEGAMSFGSLPAGAREDPQRGRTSCDVRIQHPGPKETSFPKKSPLAVTTKGQQGGTEFPSHTQGYDKGPLLICKENLLSTPLEGGVIHRVLQELRDFALRAAPPHVGVLG